MTESPNFITNESREQIKRYIDSICADTTYLCKNKENKELCATNSIHYSSLDAVNKTCDDVEKGKECESNFDECKVTTKNFFDEDGNDITTSFVNIIIPIPSAFDKDANQKFLRLPPLSSSKKPKSRDLCNVCACMNRFSTSPGASASVGINSYTSPGQDICIYPDFIEHYYYPVSIEQLNNKISTQSVKINKLNVLNKNIISAYSEDDLHVTNLYDLLIQNDIPPQITTDFILKVLYKNDDSKQKELELHLISKQKNNFNNIKNGAFYKNMSFFYGVTVSFIFLILILLI